MNQSHNISDLADALAKAQKAMTLPKKNREVTVKTKTGGSYKFEYTTFDFIIEHIRKPLTENGLWFVQTTDIADGNNILRTTLTHSSGQWISGAVKIPPTSGMQELGSALTYLKRYALSSLLGIASEEDDDANVADGNNIDRREDRHSEADRAPPAAPDRKAAATKWANDALATVGLFKNAAEFSAWHRVNANAVATVRDFNESAHKRLTDAIAKKSAEFFNHPIAAE